MGNQFGVFVAEQQGCWLQKAEGNVVLEVARARGWDTRETPPSKVSF